MLLLKSRKTSATNTNTDKGIEEGLLHVFPLPCRGGVHQIYVMRADGTGVRLLTNLALGAESPTWSPDGFWLAFVAYTGEGKGISAREIYLMQIDGQPQVRLTHNAFDDTEVEWAWSP